MSRNLVVGRYMEALQSSAPALVDQAQMIRDFERDLEAFAKEQTPAPTIGTTGGVVIGTALIPTHCHVCRTDPCPTPRVFVGIDSTGCSWHRFTVNEMIDLVDAVDNMMAVREIVPGPDHGTNKVVVYYPKDKWATLHARAKQ